jgi:hypothetical protein
MGSFWGNRSIKGLDIYAILERLYGVLLLRVERLLEAARYRYVWGRAPRIEKKRCHSLIKPCIVAIAIRHSLLLSVSRSFMPAVDSTMHQPAVQNVAPPASRPMVGRGILLAEGVADFANAMPAKCIAPSVRTVEVRRKCLFSHETRDPSIVVIAINRSVLFVPTTDDRAGNPYDRDCCEARRFV